MNVNGDDENNIYYILGRRIKFKDNFYFSKNNCIEKLVIKVYNNLIYIFTNIFFCVLDQNYIINKLLILNLWKIKTSFINNIIRKNNKLFIFMKKPKYTIIFNLNNNEIISIIEGLSGEYIFNFEKKNNILIKDDDKIMEINYKLGKLINIKFFHEVYCDYEDIKSLFLYQPDGYEEEKFSIVYKNKIIGKLNSLELKYVLENFKGFKYEYILNKDNFIINLKK